MKRLLACAVVALAGAFPAAASAQVRIDPPGGDNYLEPIFVSDPEAPGRFPGQPIGFIVDTSTYTVQQDMYNPPGDRPGPVEPTQCGNAVYGNTAWAFFRSDRWGLMEITTSGSFDTVIGIIPFNNPLRDAAPQIDNGACYDGLSGFAEEAVGLVSPRQWYALQVGGTGTPQGGQVQVTFDLGPPPKAEGRAFLFWKTGPLRVSEMYIRNVPAGHRVELRCTKRACRKQSFTVKDRNKSVFDTGWMPGPGFKTLRQKGEPGGPRLTSFDKSVHAAVARVPLLRNQKVKRGAKIELRIKQQGFIGQYYRWKVGRNEISSATTRCLNPGSNKPRRKCSG
jgi:hypothetical protein